MTKLTIEAVDEAIRRWQRRLTRAANALAKLERQRRRLGKPASKPDSKPVAVHKPVDPLIEHVADQLGIPPFLQRSQPSPQAEAIKAEIAAKKKAKAKAKARIETMKAKQRGDLKRMPLTGKAALEAIRNGN